MTLMVYQVGTDTPGIILTALAVIFIVGLKCVPPRVDSVGDFETISKEDTKYERTGVANYYG